MIIVVIVNVLMLIMAIFFLTGRGAFLISGYNMMSREQKAQYNERALSRFTGLLLLAICFSIALMLVGVHFALVWVIWVAVFLIIVLSLAAVIYMNTSNRFFRPDANPAVLAQIKRKNRISTIISTVVCVAVLIGAGVMFYLGERDSGVNVGYDHVQIQGIYGLSISFSEIAGVSLLNQTMQEIGVGRRINGFDVGGNALKGHFSAGLLFVQKNKAPTIQIKRHNQPNIYISFRNSEHTEMLFNELQNTIPQENHG